MTAGATFDTGALIALERANARMKTVMHRMELAGLTVTVPAAVLAEWWRRGHEHTLQRLLRQLVVEPTTERIAKLAGEAAGQVGATAIDAIVMASAAQRGDVVYTSDYDDLDRLRAAFPSVTVLRC